MVNVHASQTQKRVDITPMPRSRSLLNGGFTLHEPLTSRAHTGGSDTFFLTQLATPGL